MILQWIINFKVRDIFCLRIIIKEESRMKNWETEAKLNFYNEKYAMELNLTTKLKFSKFLLLSRRVLALFKNNEFLEDEILKRRKRKQKMNTGGLDLSRCLVPGKVYSNRNNSNWNIYTLYGKFPLKSFFWKLLFTKFDYSNRNYSNRDLLKSRPPSIQKNIEQLNTFLFVELS